MKNKPPLSRGEEISDQFSKVIDQHLAKLVAGEVEQMLEIEDFAEQMHLHPTHLSNTIKEVTGTSACGIYQLKIIDMAHTLLKDRSLSIKEIASQLSFDASQFTKWFKRFHHITPKEYRAGKPFQLKY